MQPGSQIYVSIDHYLLAIITFKRLLHVIAMHARKGLYTLCVGKHGARYKTNVISQKPVLTFQTLMLATLGKWATTYGRVFFLCKSCSWTLLPGLTWLQMPIIRLCQLRFKLQNTFCFFKTCWRLYDASQPPGRLQGALKQCLRY